MANYNGTDNLEVMADAINYNKHLLSLVLSNAKKDELIVDLGSGIGTFAIELVKNGFSVRCVEPDSKQAAVISAAGLDVSKSLDGIEDETVDYVYSLNVLEHIEDDMAILRQINRKLKFGGKVLIYVPAFQTLYSSMDKKVGHYRRYIKSDLIKKLELANFSIEKARYVDSMGFFASLYFRFAGNDSGTLNRNALIAYDRFVFPISKLCDNLFGLIFGKNVTVLARK